MTIKLYRNTGIESRNALFNRPTWKRKRSHGSALAWLLPTGHRKVLAACRAMVVPPGIQCLPSNTFGSMSVNSRTLQTRFKRRGLSAAFFRNYALLAPTPSNTSSLGSSLRPALKRAVWRNRKRVVQFSPPPPHPPAIDIVVIARHGAKEMDNEALFCYWKSYGAPVTPLSQW